MTTAEPGDREYGKFPPVGALIGTVGTTKEPGAARAVLANPKGLRAIALQAISRSEGKIFISGV